MTPLWSQFFDTPISGNAKLLALRLAQDAFDVTPAPLNVREFAHSLRLMPFEYESAFHELRHPDIAWLTDNRHDRPMLKAGALPRLLFAGVPSVEAIQAKQQQQKGPHIERGVILTKDSKR